MSQSIQAIRGMKDVLPSDMAPWYEIEATWQETVALFGYEEIRMPLVEKAGLFQRGIGDVTDIVEKEMYVFSDRQGDQLALRPEGTAQCIRAVLEAHLLRGQQPKLWYQGPMFRHERPQKGRYRQFHQLGVEALGYSGIDIEIEQILLCQHFFKALGLQEDLILEINSLGNTTARLAYIQALRDYCQPVWRQWDPEVQARLEKNPLRVLDSKDPNLQHHLAQAPRLIDFLEPEERADLDAFIKAIEHFGIAYQLNHRLVRGLDYYTGHVFEWTTQQLGAQGTVCAGGRYDGLVQTLGGPPTPTFGFGMGVERLVHLISDSVPPVVPDVYLMISGLPRLQRFEWAEMLRAQAQELLPDLRMVMHLTDEPLKVQFKKADKSQAWLAVIIGAAEAAQESVTIKALRHANLPQVTVPRLAAAQTIADYLDRMAEADTESTLA